MTEMSYGAAPIDPALLTVMNQQNPYAGNPAVGRARIAQAMMGRWGGPMQPLGTMGSLGSLHWQPQQPPAAPTALPTLVPPPPPLAIVPQPGQFQG